MNFSKLFTGKRTIRAIAMLVCIFFLTRTFLIDSIIGVSAAESGTVEVQQIGQTGEIALSETVTDESTAVPTVVDVQSDIDTVTPETSDTETVKSDTADAIANPDNPVTVDTDEVDSVKDTEETLTDTAEISKNDANDSTSTTTDTEEMEESNEETEAVTHTLTGKVTDEEGAGIVGATVNLSVSDTVKYSGTTEEDGTYRITEIEPETYQLSVAHNHFSFASEEIDLSAADVAGEYERNIGMTKIKPVITAVTDVPTWISATPEKIKVKIDVKDDKVKVTNLFYKEVGEDEFHSVAIDAAEGRYILEIDNPQNEANKISYEIYCVNEVGNESDTITVEVKIDLTAPEIDIVENYVCSGNAIEIKGTVTDTLSGVEEVLYKEINDNEYTVMEFDKNTGAFSFAITTLEQEVIYQYDIYSKDKANNESVPKRITVRFDTVKPKFCLTSTESSEWAAGEIIINGTISDFSEVVKFNCEPEQDGGSKAEWELEKIEDTGEYSFTISIPEQNYSGKYQINCEDEVGNKETLSVSVNMDNTAGDDGSISITANPGSWTKEEVVLSGIVIDEFSGVKEIFLQKGAEGERYLLAENFITKTDDKHWEFTYPVPETDCNEDYFIYYTDKANNTSADEISAHVFRDNTCPVLEGDTDYQVGKWTNSDIVITGTIKDTLSGIIEFTCLPGINEKAEGKTGKEAVVARTLMGDGSYLFNITIPAQCFQGKYTITATDQVGNTTTLVQPVMMDNKIELPRGTAMPVIWTNAAVTVEGSAKDDYSGIDKVFLRKGENGIPIEIASKFRPDLAHPETWSFNEMIPAQNYAGNYYLYFTDFAGNISKTVPLTVKMDNESPSITAELNEEDWSNTIWTSTDVVIAITMKDNLSGIAQLSYKESEDSDYIPVIGNDSRTDGVLIESGSKKDSYLFTLPREKYEGEHTFYFTCIDQAGNELEESDIIKITTGIDIGKPTVPMIKYNREVFSTVLETITFGFFNPSVVVTVSATDQLSGVDKIVCSFEGKAGEYVAKADYNANTVNDSIEFTIPKEIAFSEFKGTVKAVAYDKAGNASDTQDSSQDTKGNLLDGIVMDSISPTRTITFPTPRQIVSKDSLATRDTVQANQENTDSIFFYDGTVNATVVVKEANFYADDIVVKVNDDSRSLDWNHDGDEHTADITLSGEGDYVITISYTDRSTNKMIDYRSETITIDTTYPKIDVVYSQRIGAPSEPTVSETGGRVYYHTEPTATIIVTEHNFRAEDVEASFTAQNIAGDDIENNLLAALKTQLSSSASWSSRGDTHTATIVYSADANYTFDVNYSDLALHQTDNYEMDDFVVDTIAPTNLAISYRTGLFETVLEAVTFGYYNSKVAVTVTAEDITSGISRFEYSYLRGAGVSNVNAELLEQTIASAEIQYSDNGLHATATFEIPREVLDNNNQFNGTIDFVAYDHSENSSSETGQDRLIVDNMAPLADITYNQPIQELNGISYYAGNIEANIHITEANFFSEDVTVTITHDGAASPADVRWADNGEDEHIGTFMLNEEGDYTVNVAYADRSQNEMVEYTSDQLTIDTKPPEISFDGIADKSAHNEEIVGFSVTATDTNIDVASFRPVLMAVVMRESGKLEQITLPDGKPEVILAGEKYVYHYANLEVDGIYSLSCMATDLAGNTFNDITVAQSNNTVVETVTFSVNRNGSTFMPDDSTQKLTDDYYVRNIQKDIVLMETNVDPLRSYTVTLNDEELKENIDYQVIKDEQEGSWNKYIYNIDKSLFVKEGEYKIIISSQDKANNNAFSDMKGVEVNYIVDETPPTITPSGMQAGGIYEADSQMVTIIPRDDGGRLDSLKVIINDDRGKAITDANSENVSVRIDLAGEELFTALEARGGKLNFTIPANIRPQNIRIISNDCAKDENGITNITNLFYDNITVSTNPLILFYANKPLFFGTIGGILLATGGGTSLIVIRRRRLFKVNKG